MSQRAISTAEIADSSIEAAQAGATVVHLHVREDDGTQIGRPELFKYVVIMSAGAQNAETAYPEFFKPDVANKKLKLLWMGIGKDDNLTGAGAKALHEALTKAGIKHTFDLGEGRHEWVVWRHHLRDVAPLLFQSGPAKTTTTR